MLITHEWIESIGGSENVFRELLATFPDAAAGCLWNNMPGTFDREVMESSLAAGILRGRKAATLPIQPRVWRDFPIGDHETVLASSHAFGHHLATRAAREGRRAFTYVHTPARYVWAPEVEVRGRGPVARGGSLLLKRIDRRATHADVNYVANSQYVRARIQRAWDRDASVIYPAVDIERIQSVADWRSVLSAEDTQLFERIPSDGFVLGASRLVSYKRLDLAMDVGEQLGMPVVIAGSGPEEAVLRAKAAAIRVPVIFAGRVSDEQLFALYQQATLFVFMAVEDFGIMPVEALACGTPALVNRVGGARESIERIGGGAVVPDEADRSELLAAARHAIEIDLSGVGHRASTFSRASFRRAIEAWVGCGGRSR